MNVGNLIQWQRILHTVKKKKKIVNFTENGFVRCKIWKHLMASCDNHSTTYSIVGKKDRGEGCLENWAGVAGIEPYREHLHCSHSALLLWIMMQSCSTS